MLIANRTLSYNINAISSISQKVVANLQVLAYGLKAVDKTIDPCGTGGLTRVRAMY